jgi:hypothetical protein
MGDRSIKARPQGPAAIDHQPDWGQTFGIF